MGRAHERAYDLLAKRVRLGTAARRALYVTIAALVLSGIWWIGVHFASAWLVARDDDLQRLAWEAIALRTHGAATFATLLALGAMGAYHVRLGWGLGRNRGSGSAVVVVLATLVITGYALYYLVTDASRTPISVLHWGVGLGLVPLLITHIALGRRSRNIPFGGRDAHHRDIPALHRH